MAGHMPAPGISDHSGTLFADFHLIFDLTSIYYAIFFMHIFPATSNNLKTIGGSLRL